MKKKPNDMYKNHARLCEGCSRHIVRAVSGHFLGVINCAAYGCEAGGKCPRVYYERRLKEFLLDLEREGQEHWDAQKSPQEEPAKGVRMARERVITNNDWVQRIDPDKEN